MRRQLSEHWSIDVDESFRRRIDPDGSLVFVAPRRTVRLVSFTGGKRDPRATVEGLRRTSSPAKIVEFSKEAEGLLCYGYVLLESDPSRMGAAYRTLYGFAVAEQTYLQMAISYDDEGDEAWARRTWESAELARPGEAAGVHAEPKREPTRKQKPFRLRASEIKPLATGRGACPSATDLITVEGRGSDTCIARNRTGAWTVGGGSSPEPNQTTTRTTRTTLACMT